MTSKPGNWRGGFTLTELLILIGVIASLAAILLPVLGEAMNSDACSRCVSNLGQLNRAMLMYSRDWDGRSPFAANKYQQEGAGCRGYKDESFYRFSMLNRAECIAPDPSSGPNEVTKVGVLDPYLKKRDIWRCPADTGNRSVAVYKKRDVVAPFSSFYAIFGTSYCYHLWFDLGQLTPEQHKAWSGVAPMTFFDGGREPASFKQMGSGSGDTWTVPAYASIPHHPVSWHKPFMPRGGIRKAEPGQINVVFSSGETKPLTCESKRVIKVRDREVRSWTDAWVKSRWRTNAP
jgi:type II secretory pathway pseudopilin PulG